MDLRLERLREHSSWVPLADASLFLVWKLSSPLCTEPFFPTGPSEIVGSLTTDATLFHTEFVVKARDQGDEGTRFGWHQDGGYNTEPSAGGAIVPDMPHISLWCALDDMSVDNGALRVIPFDRNPIDHPIAYTAPPRPGVSPPAHISPSASHDPKNKTSTTMSAMCLLILGTIQGMRWKSVQEASSYSLH